MTNTRTVRGPEQRKKDVLARLTEEVDIWVASAAGDGTPYLVPLAFHWDGQDVWLCTRLTNPTGRNLAGGGRTRLALGHTRDVVLLDGDVTTLPVAEVPTAVIEEFAAKSGWDPRGSGPAYVWFRVRPTAVEAWHEEPELAGRHLMRGGVWVV
ncbi:MULTISPECIES: pyridoxamine 5'-phosphate oxidase [Streptomyces]|uniref:pyridoxamine 5'-phosphate oxidase family protein n=1 Tax=Streptomyces TaxID=1883 RepID=UPI00093F6605|nr:MULTISPECIES: pyridoxamine 5'-phosphate oxidase [Streptomyces]MBX9421694.1 pyridoxamine 5'-phosphate oxidase [Streptomyces lateritius]OKJ66083.1 pyridoxamine 5'-phosphate oxidase [Streptomyces sp. CB02261]